MLQETQLQPTFTAILMHLQGCDRSQMVLHVTVMFVVRSTACFTLQVVMRPLQQISFAEPDHTTTLKSTGTCLNAAHVCTITSVCRHQRQQPGFNNFNSLQWGV